MKFVRLTPYRLAALEALATFTFLVPHQFLRLGITTNRQNLTRSVLKRAKPHALLDYGNVGPFHVYCLSKRGAIEVADNWNLQSVPYPKEGVQFCKDLNHRLGTVDFLIELHDWASRVGATVDFHQVYFNGTGAQRSKLKYIASTRHHLENGFIESDADFQITLPTGQSVLCVFEYHRGHYVKRIVEQLERHMIALHEGVISERYDFPISHLVLSVFEHEATRKTVMERLRRWPKFQPFREFFQFATLDDLKEDFSLPWKRTFRSDQMPLFTLE